MKDGAPNPSGTLSDSWRELQRKPRGYCTISNLFKVLIQILNSSEFWFSLVSSLEDGVLISCHTYYKLSLLVGPSYFASLSHQGHFPACVGNADAENCKKHNRKYSARGCSAAVLVQPSYSEYCFQGDTQKLPQAETSLHSMCGQAPHTLGLYVCGSHILELLPYLSPHRITPGSATTSLLSRNFPWRSHLKHVSLL